jgi:putative transposase
LDRQENMNILIDQISYYLEKYHAKLLGYVLMPNHIHLINYFKEQNYLSDFMRGVKRYSSKLIANEIENYQPELISNISYKHRKQNKKIWNDRFHDEVIYTTKFLVQKLNYIHNNPCQPFWHLVEKPEDYKYSSALFYLTGEVGLLPVTHYSEYFSIPVG